MFKFTLQPSIMFIVFASFNHLKLPISIIIPVTISQIVYNCMTIIFANSILLTIFAYLVVAWLDFLNIKNITDTKSSCKKQAFS